MRRSTRWLTLATQGAVLFGLAQAFGLVNFNAIFFSFLSSLLNLLVAGLLGGDLGLSGDSTV